MSKEILETVARESLLEAARQRRELGDLRENLFRYIVMNKLSRKNTFGKVGFNSDKLVKRSLVLEHQYKPKKSKVNPDLIDLVSIKKSSRKDPTNDKYQPQPLAIEMKTNHNSDLKKDLKSCRHYLKSGGSMRFQYSMLLVAGSNKPPSINPRQSSKSKLLYGYLDSNLKPVIKWISE
tara:strand:+ start:186 stop:719 length:534 start_codon:yes stop_codon:yes gene_type:complete